MQLQLLHLRSVSTIAQFRLLSPISQSQYLRTVDAQEPPKDGAPIEGPLEQAERFLKLPWLSAVAYAVVASDRPDVVLYDLWLLDGATNGCVFAHGTTQNIGVNLRWHDRFFSVDSAKSEDPYLTSLAKAIDFAERVPLADATLMFVEEAPFVRRLVGFQTEAGTPQTHDGWDSLFAEHNYPLISEAFVRRYRHAFGPDTWRHVWQSERRSDDFVREFARTPADLRAASRKLSEACVRENQEHVDWDQVCDDLSEDFIREFADKLNWLHVSRNSRLSENVIRDFKDQVDWPAVSMSQQLSEPFIEEFCDRISWEQLSASPFAHSIEFLRAHALQLDWNSISWNAPNLVDLAAAFPERISWGGFANARNLTTEFLVLHQAKFDWSRMVWLTEDQVREFASQVHWVNLATARWEPWVESVLREHSSQIDSGEWEEIRFEGRQSVAFKNEVRARLYALAT
jgi:hypothetical protein